MGGLGLAVLLPGCGAGGSGGTTGPNAEVQVVPPVDAQGNAYSIEDESKPQKKAK
ncbi:hypothetical protein TA3x_000121 [Tundrisphaera sp. TA3]|uniref:hypothetical protein n=1 Tax=Tundrisphaera sp. TA3 TaxID=3435775 RepID=UPI003EBD1ED5